MGLSVPFPWCFLSASLLPTLPDQWISDTARMLSLWYIPDHSRFYLQILSLSLQSGACWNPPSELVQCRLRCLDSRSAELELRPICLQSCSRALFIQAAVRAELNEWGQANLPRLNHALPLLFGRANMYWARQVAVCAALLLCCLTQASQSTDIMNFQHSSCSC